MVARRLWTLDDHDQDGGPTAAAALEQGFIHRLPAGQPNQCPLRMRDWPGF